MILTVTLNFALDLTYHVERFERGATTRVPAVARRAGGKGVNAARVLHALGRDVAVTGLAGGFTASEARAELAGAGIRDQLVEVAGESRITIIVAERDGGATGFSEPGPHVSTREWAAFRTRFEALLRDTSAIILAGSLPPGVPQDAYAQLIELAHGRGTPALLDAEGDALEHGIAAAPEIVKINATELAGVSREPDLGSGVRAIRTAGAKAVVVTQGANGMTYMGEDGTLHASPPETRKGNPTGAGDAASAALIAGLLDATPWPQRLADATALSAAAVCAPLAGSFDDAVYRRVRPQIVL